MTSLAVFVNSALAAPYFGPDFHPSSQPNMNGDYVFSSTPGGTPGKFPKHYKDYPGGVEFFDAYTPPITTHYSQVWWSPLAPAPFPDAVVNKYAGRKMAIVGWEIDQVMRTQQGDISVPISASYNHHYVAQVIGAGSKFTKEKLSMGDPRAVGLMAMSHGRVDWEQEQYITEEVDASASPSHQYFSSANGGEYRKTYHGFAPGYALVIDSPTQFQVTPMQIDTWNREKMNFTAAGERPTKFVPGPLPHASAAPADATYSALLECPMTTRLRKVVDGAYMLRTGGACAQPILSYQECYHAVASTITKDAGHSYLNTTGSDPTRPPGCSATVGSPAQLGMVHTYFNRLADSSTTCAAAVTTLAGSSAAASVNLSVSLDVTPAQLATITLKGPSDVWFGVGLNATAMCDAPWTIIVDGSGNVSERKLGTHQAGSALAASVKVISNAVSAGVRTVVLTRPLKGAGDSYFTFNGSEPTVPFIAASGSGADLAFHKLSAASTLTLLPAGTAAGACVCPEAPKAFGHASGKLVYQATSQSVDLGNGAVGFQSGKCAEWPSTELINQTNPTCDIRHYEGGQWACHHGWSLLDAEQEIPWPNEPLVLHHKYRFWVQPYNETYHTPLKLGERLDAALLIGSPWEYDVPTCATLDKAAAAAAGCSYDEASSTWLHTVRGWRTGKTTFAALNFHCHAPTCLSMAVYACAKGTKLTDCNESNGKLICLQRPVYGGSGDPAIHGTKFDEPGYIAIPDCFWGKAENGLEPPVDLDGVPLYMLKKANATWRHYGEMAGGQPWSIAP